MQKIIKRWFLGIEIVIQSIVVLIPLMFIVPLNGYMETKYGWIGMICGLIASLIVMGFYGYGFKKIIYPND